jgi:CHAD domain-containing protein
MKFMYPVNIKKSFKENVINILPMMYDNMMKYKEHVIGHPRMKTQLHRMRITGKPMRYIMEIMETTLGREFKNKLQEIKNVIELMGDIHDCDVFIGELNGYLNEIRAYNRFKKSLNEKFNLKCIINLIQDLRKKRNESYESLCDILKEWEKNNFREKLITSMQIEKLNEVNFLKR